MNCPTLKEAPCLELKWQTPIPDLKWKMYIRAIAKNAGRFLVSPQKIRCPSCHALYLKESDQI